MNVLFVSSGNSKNGISPIIKNQAESLMKKGVDVKFYQIQGKGIKGYLKNIKPLRNFIRKNHYDVIHAHYSLSGIVASFAGANPLIVSLMGSDVKAKKWFKNLLWIFYKFFWRITIVKSEDMKYSLGFNKINVLPNGVDFMNFKPLNSIECQARLGWDASKIHILFAANPNRHEKNFSLAKNAVSLINDQKIELHFLQDVKSELMPIYFNASSVVLLTSLWEGSPNVIKEAMACNIPIVSTKVGDVEWLFGTEIGYFLTNYDSMETAENINKAIAFSIKYGRNQGRKRLANLGLDSDTIAENLISIYHSVSR